MEFVTPIITPIAESLMDPVKKHLGFFFSSTNFVRVMRARVLELNNMAHGLEKKKEANDANNLVVPDHVPDWLAQVKTINEEAGDIQTYGNGCLDIKKRYKAGKRSFDILNKIDDLEKQESKIKWTNERIPLGMVISSTMPTTSEPVHDDDGTQNMFSSRQLIFKDALKSLEPHSKTQKIALCGMGGVGKTTMMEELKQVVEKRGLFKWVLKVVIGQNYDQFAIQQAIAQCIGEDLTEKARDVRADSLRKRFENMSNNGTKDILIILDDVWEVFDLKDIGITSPLPKGFKLLLTSRYEKVCIKMDVETTSIFRMVGLEAKEANDLFWDTVKLTDEDDELYKIGEGILRKCGGLPLAIKTIALTLKCEEKDAWRGALVRLQRHDLEDIYAIVGDIFEISYNNLSKDDDKAIFILCGLFPDDFNIDMEELVRYGWGLQLFHKVYSLIEARRRTNTSVNNLIRANLLTESNNKGCVKMHDLARAFILSNISKFKQVSIVNSDDKSEWPTQDVLESCERILLKCTGMSEFLHDFDYPNLALLKLMNGDKLLKFPEDFHKRMEKLEVLAYDEMQSPLLHLVSLPYSICIQTLCLNSCFLVDNDISFLGELINLEVLSIVHCSIQKLPSTIGKLKRLKLLDLTGCMDLCVDDFVFQSLEKLEELYMSVFNGKVIRFSNANCEELERLSSKLSALEIEFFENILKPKNVSFKQLQRFRISVGCLLNKETNRKYRRKSSHKTGSYFFKNTLKLVTNCSDLLESKINELFSKTEELHLCVKDMVYLEDISMHASQCSIFCNLRVLHVFKCADLTYLFTNPVANGLKKLEILTISSCHVLKSLVSLSEDVNAMELPKLLELNLDDLPNFTSIFHEYNSSTTKSFLNNEVVIPKLSKLSVGDMKNLKQIWPFHIPSGGEDKVSMLREIEVNDCNSLVNIFPKNPMRLLANLEEVRVKRCCSIEVLFDINLGQIEQQSSSNLRKIKVQDLEELREVWRIEDENNSSLLIIGFQAMESIHIERCRKFRNVFTPTTANFDLRALNDIDISECGEDSGINDGELVNDTQKQEITGVLKLETSKVDENMSIVAFQSYHLTNTFHNLRHVKFDGFKADVIFEIESSSVNIKFDELEADVMFEIESSSINRERTQQQPLRLLPFLEDIELENMDMLSHVWKWNELSVIHKYQPQSSMFKNLTSIRLYKCNGIKYLFSPLMSKLLSSLKTIKIISCEGMEEVVSNRDDDDEVMTTSTSTTTLFPHLDYLYLDRLDNLKHIDGDVAKGMTSVIHDQLKISQVSVAPWCLCQYSREIEMQECHALSSVIPSYAAGHRQKLQVLVIHGSRSMEEVFETKEINNKDISGSSSSSSKADHGSSSILPVIPRQKQITMHELPNLKVLKISECDLLEYIFTYSTLGSLKKLENLSIVNCTAMKVIVREENEEASSKAVVVFPRLKSIELDHLPNLAGFFLGMNIDFKFPSLDYVMINDCPQMTVFASGESTTPKLMYIHTQLGKHNLECGLNFHRIPSTSSDRSISCPAIAEGTPWSFHNLIEMHLKSDVTLQKIVPSNELLQLQNLEKIIVLDTRNVEVIFEELINNDSQTVVKFPNLREVDLNWLKGGFKYIWKVNKCQILEFQNLTRVSINLCDSLEHVFTSSMLGSLMQLQELDIRRCDYTETIVKTEEECDGKGSEVVFPCLKFLQLDTLWSLKGFCLGKQNFTFPSLTTLIIKECSNISIFSEGRSIAPQLRVVETSFGFFHAGEDINAFIMTKKQQGIRFGECEEPSACLVM